MGEENAGIRPEHMQEATNSVIQNERLDGTMPSGPAAYHKVRVT